MRGGRAIVVLFILSLAASSLYSGGSGNGHGHIASKLNAATGGLAVSHAQYGQDRWMFERFASKVPHTFVEFGCRDGIEHSNTAGVEAAGWKGICIEAIEDIKPVRKLRYKGAICDPAMEGKSITFDMSLPGLHGVKGTTDFSMFEPSARRTKEVQVPCLSLPRLLQKNDMKHVGYMTVDLEGGELAFLGHFDFSSFRVDILQVECNTAALCAKTKAKVEANGFMQIHKHKFAYPPTGGGDLVFQNLAMTKDATGVELAAADGGQDATGVKLAAADGGQELEASEEPKDYAATFSDGTRGGSR